MSSSFWSSIGAALSSVFATAVTDVKAIAAYFKPMVQASAQEIATLAMQSVLAEAPKVLAGTEKFSNAVSTVITTLGTQGKAIALSDASAAVQAAYNYVSAQVNAPKTQ